MTFTLRPYQRELVNEARQAIAQGAKGVLVQSPPGSGKSVVIAEIAKLTVQNGGRVLFIVHRKELVEQIASTFLKHEINMNQVRIDTVVKTRNRLSTIEEPTLIITDETHHSRAKTYREIYDYFSNAWRLGFTATPWRMSGKGFEDIYDVMVKGKSVQWLIDNDSLAPFDYYSVNLADLDKLKQSSTGDYTKKSMDDAVTKAIYGDAVQHYKELANNQQAILYAHSVEASQGFAEAFKAQGINAEHADAKTPKKQREQIMDDFRNGKIKVLCNVDLISEGFDVPDCNVVILLRPTASLVLHMQQSMRSMRYKPNKKAIIIDHVANYLKHGIPTTEHEWSLKSWKKKGSNNSKNSTIPLKECMNCFGVIESKETHCPLCGHEFEVEINELEQVDTTLEKVDAVSFEADYERIRLKREWAGKDRKELETVEDYYLFAKARGYKDSWLKFQIPEFKHLNWPQFYIQLKPLKQKYKNLT